MVISGSISAALLSAGISIPVLPTGSRYCGDTPEISFKCSTCPISFGDVFKHQFLQYRKFYFVYSVRKVNCVLNFRKEWETAVLNCIKNKSQTIS